MQKIDHKWVHDFLGVRGIIELVPISWIKPYMLEPAIAGPRTLDAEGRMVKIADLAEHIARNGLYHAGVLEIARNTQRARLITGNHRITALSKHLGQNQFPIYVVVIDEFTDEMGQGVEVSDDLTALPSETVGQVIAPPSAIFLDLRHLNTGPATNRGSTRSVPS